MKSHRMAFSFSSVRVGAVLTAAGFLAGCPPTPQPADPKTLITASEKYQAREVEEAEAIAERYIQTNPSGERLDEAYYIRGLSRFTRGSRPLAAMDLQKAIAVTKRPDLKGKAHRALGDIEFENQNWGPAQTNYEAALKTATLPAAVITAIHYRLGVCLQAQGQWGKSQAMFLKVVTDNNDAALKERAVSRINASAFSLQFGAFADAAKARELREELEKAGIAATIDSELREGQFLYLVRSGKFANWSEAALSRDRLLTKYPLVIIIP